MLRNFSYGWDFTEFDEDDKVVIYYAHSLAKKSLEEYINDVNYAFDVGNMDEPYQDDCKIEEITEELLTKITEHNAND